MLCYDTISPSTLCGEESPLTAVTARMLRLKNMQMQTDGSCVVMCRCYTHTNNKNRITLMMEINKFTQKYKPY